ncbi:MAG: SPOR domain-containing protein [Spirochaetaceae bacterium]|nr:SPOR domain-containing protein [Spirochaetaceae bacterium]
MKKLGLFLFLIIFSFIHSEEVTVQYETKETFKYIVYEGFYSSKNDAKANISILNGLDVKDLKIVEKTVKGVKKYGIYAGEFSSYTYALKRVNLLKAKRFGGVIYKRKITIKVPIVVNKKEAEEKKKEELKSPKKKVKRKPLKKIIRKKSTVYGKLAKNKTLNIIIGSGFTLLFEGISYYFYTKAKTSYDSYTNESDAFMLPARWDEVQLNSKRYQSWMYLGAGGGLFTVYQIFYVKSKPKSALSLNLIPKEENLCLSMSLHF